MQLSPNLHWLRHKVDQEGIIGELLQIDAFGKMDRRAGGEDMSVLGGHVFDLCRLFCGASLQAHAHTPPHPTRQHLRVTTVD